MWNCRPAFVAVLGICSFVAVYFQFVVPIGTTGLRVNAADFLVVPLALAGLAAWLGFNPGKLNPRSPTLYLWWCAFAVALAFGLALGSARIGHLSMWGLSNRLFGWTVVAGYILAGWAIVGLLRQNILNLALAGFVIAGSIICVLAVGEKLAAAFGIMLGAQHSEIEGFSGNSNAFAMLLLACLCAIAYLDRVQGSTQWRRILTSCWGISVLGLFLTGSRAAWLAYCCLVLFHMIWRQPVLLRNLVGAILIASYLLLGVLSNTSGGLAMSEQVLLQTELESFQDASNLERWHLNVEGLTTWLDAPILGVGLGVFLDGHRDAGGNPVIIHNTWLWALAELGVFGFIFLVGLFVSMLRGIAVWPRATVGTGHDVGLRVMGMGLLVAFGVMSQFHDMLYQRVFWLVMGVATAYPLRTEGDDSRGQ